MLVVELAIVVAMVGGICVSRDTDGRQRNQGSRKQQRKCSYSHEYSFLSN
jgi:hypothetical protein